MTFKKNCGVWLKTRSFVKCQYRNNMLMINIFQKYCFNFFNIIWHEYKKFFSSRTWISIIKLTKWVFIFSPKLWVLVEQPTYKVNYDSTPIFELVRAPKNFTIKFETPLFRLQVVRGNLKSLKKNQNLSKFRSRVMFRRFRAQYKQYIILLKN